MTMEPVFAGVFGVAFGGDDLTARVVVGARTRPRGDVSWSSSARATEPMRPSNDSRSDRGLKE